MENLSEHKSGTSIEKYFSSDGLYKVISIGSYGLNNEYIDQGIRAVKNKTTESKLVRSGQLTMVLNDKTANGNLIGRCLLISTDNEFIVNQRTEIIIPGPDLNGNYAYYYLNGPFRSKVKRIAQGGTQIYVNYSSVKKQKINYPIKDEQIKISKLLKIIKKLITLYERKLKLLSQAKKYFLDNLFAEKEYPNLRFKEFTDAWEQRKLLKVCKKEDNKRIPIKEQERKEGNTPYFGANGIQGYIDGYTHDGTNILIAEDGANNVRNYPIKLITGKIWVNNHAHVLKVNTKTNNGNFLVGAIKKINFYRYLVGSSRYKLTAESLNQVKIKIAKQSEQEKIGKLLKNIEKLLTLYENKQQHLTKIKKTLLNTMFI